MPLRSVVLLVVLAAVAVFAALNWSVIMAPTTLSLGFAQVQAPLGLVLLGLIAVLGVLFLVYVVYLQSSALLETRRHARELQTARELADQAEASRFTDLRSHLDTRLTDIEHSLAAQLGELRDRLDRTPAPPPAPQPARDLEHTSTGPS
jgi:uncharacterized integral membrane protein